MLSVRVEMCAPRHQSDSDAARADATAPGPSDTQRTQFGAGDAGMTDEAADGVGEIMRSAFAGAGVSVDGNQSFDQMVDQLDASAVAQDEDSEGDDDAGDDQQAGPAAPAASAPVGSAAPRAASAPLMVNPIFVVNPKTVRFLIAVSHVGKDWVAHLPLLSHVLCILLQFKFPMRVTWLRVSQRFIVTSPLTKRGFPLDQKGNTNAMAESLFSDYKSGMRGVASSLIDGVQYGLDYMQRNAARALGKFIEMGDVVTPGHAGNAATAASQRKEATPKRGAASRRSDVPTTPITASLTRAKSSPTLLSPVPAGFDAARSPSAWGTSRERVPESLAGSRAGAAEPPELPASLFTPPDLLRAAAAGDVAAEAALVKEQSALALLMRAQQRGNNNSARLVALQQRLAADEDAILRNTAAHKLAYDKLQDILAQKRLVDTALGGSALTSQAVLAPPASVWCGGCKGKRYASQCAFSLCKTCCGKAMARVGTGLRCAFHLDGPA